MGFYNTAQVCLNGHTITCDITSSSLKEKYCSKCGAETIIACPNCNSPIRGRYEVEGVISIGYNYEPPSYCHNCGKPFPWIESAFVAAKELIDEDMQELNDDEKTKFKNALPDIIANTPRTTFSATRITKYLKKITPTVQETFKQIFYRFATDVAKALLWGG
ncbi:MAG: DUF2321 domain-containing protein [Synergistaceae bacterium]|nr:DUF2321 domain-containing protein [Synergistaceae bacterium]